MDQSIINTQHCLSDTGRSSTDRRHRTRSGYKRCMKQSGNWNSITKYGVFSFFADEDDQDDHDTEELFDEDFSFQSQDIKRKM